jgi:GWxTD domain-containing protein
VHRSPVSSIDCARRVRRALSGAAASLALAWAAEPAAAKLDIEDARPLPWQSQGSLYFEFDIASFPPDSSIGRTEFYIRLPGGALASHDSLVSGGDIRVRIRVRDARGSTVVEERRTLPVPPRDRDTTGFSPGQVVLWEARLPSGWYEVRGQVEDLHTKKRGLLYIGSDEHRDGRIEGVFHVPDWGHTGAAVSELEPAWRIAHAASASRFTRGEMEIVPNPGRTYGLYAPTLRAYYEVSRHAAGAAPIPISASVRDSRETLLTAEADTIEFAGRSWGQIAFDASTLAAGSYELVVSFDAGATPTVRRLRFNVAWQPETWRGDPRGRVDEAHFLLDDPDQEENFARLTRGEQEAFLDGYWAARDPSPNTARNEAQDRFRERIATADGRWGTGFMRGMLSDRGRIYVRYGEPDEVQQELHPTNGVQVNDLAREVAEREGIESGVRLQGRGIGSDMRAFEVWTYDRLLHPSDELDQGSGPRRPMRRVFVFVDEEGYGDFVLRYAND